MLLRVAGPLASSPARRRQGGRGSSRTLSRTSLCFHTSSESGSLQRKPPFKLRTTGKGGRLSHARPNREHEHTDTHTSATRAAAVFASVQQKTAEAGPTTSPPCNLKLQRKGSRPYGTTTAQQAGAGPTVPRRHTSDMHSTRPSCAAKRSGVNFRSISCSLSTSSSSSTSRTPDAEARCTAM